MRAASAGLLADFAAGTTTRARCWKITRTDSTVFGFTDIDVDIVFDGVTYYAATGFNPSALQGRADLSVSNMEVVSFFDAASITEQDLHGGLWDNAEVEIFDVNYRNLANGRMLMGVFWLGAVSGGTTAFQAEIRGLTQALQQSVGSVYAASCSVELGSAKCGKDLPSMMVSSTVTAVASRRQFTASSLTQAEDWFGAGYLIFTGGDNIGQRMEVQTFTAGGIVRLQLQMPANIQVGDTFNIFPGCRKRFAEDCVAKFTNGVRFRGFPHVPLNDKVLGNAGLES